ncbi:transporter, CPA2 family (2.A.37) [Candidatus Koribacter versatilis Ellin345]|uniref:Transporter, CPA2 family (2.A.37) n=1 Tax=Koribacter versatilis (strain Ellin345) TaxID=204669 RepID=Q1IVD2_KORVE|nr:cation:proton antiporter [Candidatus Koribacter versatilis]ABF39168.1 transporter, CPA2 family (2.A.37) [Candidatus Koribacter versatilis Ellin345]
MSTAEFGSLTLLLFVVIASAQLLGYLFQRMRQPKVIGEILAGVLLGPSLLGHFAPRISQAIFAGSGPVGQKYELILSFLYNLGLLLLMFCSGAEVKGLFKKRDRREVTWLASVGTAVPFLLVIAAYKFIPLEKLATPNAPRMSVLLIVGIAASVTSIPVISRILHDLKILHTRFASLILGVAVIEDIVLWAVLAVATALISTNGVQTGHVLRHVIAALVYFGIGMTIAPVLLRWITRARWNILVHASPVGYVTVVLLAYSAIAAAFDVSLVFAAFLAGYGLIGELETLAPAVESLKTFSFATFIPIYFAIVGYRLDLSKTFSFSMLAIFMGLACLLKLLSAGLGARLARFNWYDSLNLAIATNARGGPGIVLASVAYDAGIINAAFYTTLVLTAILTSQAAGAWLEYILRSGKPLLTASVEELPVKVADPEQLAA